MSLLGVLALGRRMAVSRMTETVKVAEARSYDPLTLATAVYDGPARVKFGSSVGESNPAGQLVAIDAAELHLPSGTSGVEADMFAVVEASSADSALVGRVFRIKGRGVAGQTTAARYAVEDSGLELEGS